MRHILYKITNKVNGKYYIGRHSTTNIDDGYMGSGIGIKRAIKKYGIDNFEKEILAEVESTDALWDLEKSIVNETIVNDKMSYNLAYGGKHYLHGLKLHDSINFKIHQSNAGKVGGKTSYNKFGINWNKMGGSASSKKRSSMFIYKIETNEGEILFVNGLEFKQICKDRNWNYSTLHWKKSQGKKIARGKHAGFLVELISSPKN